MHVLTERIGSGRSTSAPSQHLPFESPPGQTSNTSKDPDQPLTLSSERTDANQPPELSLPTVHFATNGYDPADKEADTLLSKFSHISAEYFPFVLISTNVGTKEFQLNNPMLWRVVSMLMSNTGVQRMAELGSSLMNDLVMRLLLHGEKNLELLQALLLFTAWSVSILHMCLCCTLEYETLKHLTRITLGITFNLRSTLK